MLMYAKEKMHTRQYKEARILGQGFSWNKLAEINSMPSCF